MINLSESTSWVLRLGEDILAGWSPETGFIFDEKCKEPERKRFEEWVENRNSKIGIEMNNGSEDIK